MKKPKHKMMKHDDEAQDRALFKKMEAEEGAEPMQMPMKPGMKRGGRWGNQYARGGRVGSGDWYD